MILSDILRRAPEFSILPTNELEILSNTMVVKDYPDGHHFIEEGRSSDTFYLIVEGNVTVTRKTEHAIVEINHLKVCQSFGMVSLIDHGKPTATCTANGPVKVASLPRGAFDLLYNSSIPLANHFLHIVSRQLRSDILNLADEIRRKLEG